ncbi:MAG: branched-chain amino acid ABC transporter permease [Chloroflexi bacterium]|nr:branched-chain amino acid ABC transporter permease [Chloroflexota bacterium]
MSWLGVPRRDWVILAAVAVVVGAAPLAVSRYYLSILVTVGVYGMATVGLCLLAGYARQISLGHAAFYGLGAYASGLLAARWDWSPWITIPVGVLGSGLVAWLLGRPVLRLSGHYLAMATLGLGIVFQVALNELTELTGGPSGFSGIPSVPLAWLPFNSEVRSLYLVWALCLALLGLALWLVNTRIGRVLRAIGESELAAELLGLDTAAWKVRVFALSAAYAALAGALYAHYVTFLSPAPFGFMFSLELLVMATIGGLASVWGGLLGAGIVVVLTETLRSALPKSLPGSSGELELILFGLALVAIMALRPSGLAGLGRVLLGRWAPRAALATPTEAVEAESVGEAARVGS